MKGFVDEKLPSALSATLPPVRSAGETFGRRARNGRETVPQPRFGFELSEPYRLRIGQC